MGLSFTRLVNPRIGIVAGASEILHMSEQMTLSVLHPQPAEVNPNREKGNRRLVPGPMVNGQRFDQNKATSIEDFVE